MKNKKINLNSKAKAKRLLFYLTMIFPLLANILPYSIFFSCSQRKDREVKKGKIVSIKTWDAVGNSPGDYVTKTFYEEFNKKFPYIKIARNIIPGRGVDDRLAFTTSMAGGVGPDCYHQAHFPSIPIWIEQGFCENLDRYIKNDPQFKNIVKSAFAPAIKNGSIYGIPRNLYVMTLFYRKDLFKEAGLDPNKPPKNWAELAEYAQKLTKGEKRRYGFALLGQDWASWHWENFVWQAGGEVTERLPDGRCKIRFAEPPAVKALQFYKELRWKYKCIQPNPLQAISDNERDFKYGNTAMIMQSPEFLPALLQEGLSRDEIGIAPLPAGPTGIISAQIGGAFYIINPSSPQEKKDAAWKYIKFMTSKENQIKKWKMFQRAKILYPQPSFYEDLRMEDYVDIQPEWGGAVVTSLKFGKMEYFLKDKIEPYLAKPIQAVLTNENADPKDELEKCAKIVMKEVVQPFNKEVLKNKIHSKKMQNR